MVGRDPALGGCRAIVCKNLFSRAALGVLLCRLERSEWLSRSDGLVTVFDPWLVPELLRTQMYATVLTTLDDAVQAIQDQSRERRQDLLRQDLDPLCLSWITSEHVLYRRVGGKTVTDDQRVLLVELTARPNVTVQVIPGERDLPPVSPFQLVQGTPLVVVETSRLATHYAHDPGTVEHFKRLVGSLRQRALPPEESRKLIREVWG